MTKRETTKANPPTVASLSRALKAMTLAADAEQELGAGHLREAERLNADNKALRDMVDKYRDADHRAMLELAELHGYINRVEIEDDAAWYRQHGAKVDEERLGGAGSTGSRRVIMPPLRQRLKGVRHENSDKPDILYRAYTDRTSRFGG